MQKIHDVGKAINPDVMVICHGGPIAEPKHVEYIFKNTRGVVGFFGASSIERLAIERAVTQQVAESKTIAMK